MITHALVTMLPYATRWVSNKNDWRKQKIKHAVTGSGKDSMNETVAIVESRRWTESANAWDHWADGMANPADRINQPLLDLGDAPAGARVLDLAAGVGEPSLTQAQRLGPSGLVVASDLVPAMLTGLGRRAAGHPHPPCPVAADMTALPFASAGFDRVLCRFGLMFVPDLTAALSEMRRVLRPGGVAALAVWGQRAGNSLFDRLGMILAQEQGETADALLAPLFRFADPENLLSLAGKAGFRHADARTLTLTNPAKVEQPFWLPTLEMAFSPLLGPMAPERRAALHQRIAADFATGADEQGRVAVRMEVNLLRLET